mmetsp:Transcript_63457/g.166237  ORF Transcript_63457/g.166237 Transcript_63457/m.166237 type:complete len:341 (+) Transcript_63457:58-1080(+)
MAATYPTGPMVSHPPHGAGGAAAGGGSMCPGGPCDEPEEDDRSNMITYVGPGGAYKAEVNYKYVGHGAGDYDTVKTRRGINWCCVLGGSAAGILGLLLSVILLWPTDSGSTSTVIPFDCNAGFDRWQVGWAQAKKDWCCNSVGRGCFAPRPFFTTASPVATPAPPNKCNVGGVDTWDEVTKKFCCETYNNGCNTEAPPPAPAPLFDCDAGFENWAAGWAEDKKVWCCQNGGKGCPATTAAPTPAPPPAPAGQCVQNTDCAVNPWCNDASYKAWCTMQGKWCPSPQCKMATIAMAQVSSHEPQAMHKKVAAHRHGFLATALIQARTALERMVPALRAADEL